MYGKSPVQSLYTTPVILSANAPRQNTLAMDSSSMAGGWVGHHALLVVWEPAWWYFAPLLVVLAAFGGLWLAWVSYSEFLCMVVLGVPLLSLDWLWDICAPCVHPGGGRLWGNPHWWLWVMKQWVDCKSFGVQISRYWFWRYTHMRSLLIPLLGCVGNDSNWGQIVAGSFSLRCFLCASW